MMQVAVVALSSAARVAVAAEGRPDRYVAEFADLSVQVAPEVTEWHEPAAQPKLAGKPIFDATNPARSIIDTDLRPAPRGRAYVEFFGGDVLPGSVEAFASGAESPYRREFPHLLVDVQGAWGLPDAPRGAPVRVLERFVKRVVWQRRASERYEPGTLFFNDGRKLKYRAARWNPASVSLLLEQETTEVPLAEIAELHLPARDSWQTYLEQLALISPECTTTLVQWETTTGLRATGSLERFQARALGNAANPDVWYHLLQPAWSLDGLWVWHRTIRVRRHFRPEQPPLSCFEPSAVEQKSTFGGRAAWQRDRSVQGSPLRSGGRLFADGVGVQSYTALTWQLPGSVKAFHSRVGLDALANNGGCALAWVQWDAPPLPDGKPPAYRSPLLIGSTSLVDTGWLPAPAGTKSLTLVADPAHAERPSGADPFDVRDLVNWLEPELQLDLPAMQAAVHAQATRLLPAWEGWTLEQVDLGPVRFGNHWENNPAEPQFRVHIGARVPFLTWSRQLKLQPRHKWLMFAVSRPDKDTTPSQLQVRIDGEPVAEFEVPLRIQAADPDPLLIDLARWQGRDVRIEITHLPGGPQALIDWQGIAILDHRPGVLPVFEDQPRFAAEMVPGEGTARLDHDDPFTGTASLLVSSADVGAAQLPGLAARIRRDPQLGEYRYLVFAWKKTEGTRIALRLAQDGRWGPDAATDDSFSLRYDAGVGEKSHGAARRLDNRLPAEWAVVTRDLFQDFGAFNLTGLGFSAVDGGTARFDRIYLARTPQDAARGPAAEPSQPLALFEDQQSILAALAQGNGQAVLDAQDNFSGTRALKVTPQVRMGPAIPGWEFRIRENPGPDEYRYVRFAWKKTGGKQLLLQFAADGQFGPLKANPNAALRYAAGPLNAATMPAIALSEEVPAEWTVVTRDLFADFGEFTLTGLSLAPLDGTQAFLDQLYLARTKEDLDILPTKD